MHRHDSHLTAALPRSSATALQSTVIGVRRPLSQPLGHKRVVSGDSCGDHPPHIASH